MNVRHCGLGVVCWVYDPRLVQGKKFDSHSSHGTPSAAIPLGKELPSLPRRKPKYGTIEFQKISALDLIKNG